MKDLLKFIPAVLFAAAVLFAPVPAKSDDAKAKSHYIGWTVGKLRTGQHFKFANGDRIYQKVAPSHTVERVVNPFLSAATFYVDPANGQIAMTSPDVRVRKVDACVLVSE